VNKGVGISWDSGGRVGATAFNNTFINCGQDIVTWHKKNRVNALNNLYYHSATGEYYYNFDNVINLTSDYNIFCGGAYWKLKTHITNFATWKMLSGQDHYSISGSKPNFENHRGSRPSDFKRDSYGENFKDSPYGIHGGAYATGREIVGLIGAEQTP
jgi:hypothetical protein